ncbi:hypothetical protein [Neisseria bacilliformis]|uniref:hypothetical protein n=1 Tax=Neisseria bacilliformis TaxID=267212 RepID=UPI0028E795B6|nr:hypothetical protein [Neisseria bacilliformis]
MKNKPLNTLATALLALTLAACAAKQTDPAPAASAAGQTHAPTQANDGSSIQRAVVINENDTTRGIAAENAWIAQNLPGYRKVGQALLNEGGGIYDRIDIQAPDGSRRSVYFDIRSFFGLYNGKPLM